MNTGENDSFEKSICYSDVSSSENTKGKKHMDNKDDKTQVYQTISKFDRTHASLQEVALWTQPTTIKHVNFAGKAESFIIQTARHESGDTIFIECLDETGTTRIPLPPRVAKVIHSHYAALTRRSRKRAASIQADKRKAEGIEPGFMKYMREKKAAAEAAKSAKKAARKAAKAAKMVDAAAERTAAVQG